ncbi:melatonin receptor type 1B-B-like [Amphiura filiformis]|uniref:melatonin receptor type 1B-B-like n=1 Tax=Amphiura filiformis TaxID=82378 RepID=UPI003B216573
MSISGDFVISKSRKPSTVVYPKKMESSEGNYSTSPTAISDIPTALVTTVVVIMTLVAIIGTLGNSLVILAVVAHKKLRSIHNIFIINLAAADLIVTVIIIPFALVGAIYKGSFLTEFDAICETVGVLSVLSCATSIFSIANIALDRYICICHKNIYPKIYNRSTVPFMVMGMWLYAFLIDLPNFDFVGWGKHDFNPEVRACSFSGMKAAESGYIWFLFVFVWGISFTVICFCYSRLYLYVRRSRKAVTQNTVTLSRKSSTGIKPADKRLLKIIAVIFILFVIMWTPFCIFALLNTHVEIPFWLYFLPGHLCLSNSSINFLVYAFNKDFREGYILVLKKFTCEKETQKGNTCVNMMNINTDSTSLVSHNE